MGWDVGDGMLGSYLCWVHAKMEREELVWRGRSNEISLRGEEIET